MHEPTPNMRRRYRNPPVEEALVEFRFVPGQGWDPTLPGKLHQHAAIKSVYTGKPRTQKIVEAALEADAEVAEPGGVLRVGVRYINKIVLPDQEVELKTWFRCGPPTVPELPGKIAGFVSRVEFLYPDAVKLLLTQASIDTPEEPSAFLLDLDVLWDGGEAQLPDAIMTVVDDLHERVGSAFEAIITDAAREIFDAN